MYYFLFALIGGISGAIIGVGNVVNQRPVALFIVTFALWLGVGPALVISGRVPGPRFPGKPVRTLLLHVLGGYAIGCALALLTVGIPAIFVETAYHITGGWDGGTAGLLVGTIAGSAFGFWGAKLLKDFPFHGARCGLQPLAGRVEVPDRAEPVDAPHRGSR